jgi:CarD family transcriptional regulator
VTSTIYAIGTRVVHPCYGAGTIVRIQSKAIGEQNNAYYIIDTISRAMQVMVPVRRAESVGLRQVGEAPGLRLMLASCSDLPQEDIESDLRARQAEMRDRLKSGEFDQVVYVVRQLFYMNSRRPLGTVDRQLFDQGKEFLAGELALASNIAVDLAMQEVEGRLSEMFGEAE